MARPLRIEYLGAVYHIITRGNNCQALFTDEQNRSTSLAKLCQYCQEKACTFSVIAFSPITLDVLLSRRRGGEEKT